LMDAAKPKYGSLVDGRSGVEASGKDADGWMFTPGGAKWIREREESINRRLGLERSKLHQTETARFLRQIKDQPLFAKFKQNGDLTHESQFAFTDMLNVSPDAPRRVVSKKFSRLCTVAELTGDREVLEFLDACSRAFASQLAGSPKEKSNEEE